MADGMTQSQAYAFRDSLPHNVRYIGIWGLQEKQIAYRKKIAEIEQKIVIRKEQYPDKDMTADEEKINNIRDDEEKTQLKSLEVIALHETQLAQIDKKIEDYALVIRSKVEDKVKDNEDAVEQKIKKIQEDADRKIAMLREENERKSTILQREAERKIEERAEQSKSGRASVESNLRLYKLNHEKQMAKYNQKIKALDYRIEKAQEHIPLTIRGLNIQLREMKKECEKLTPLIKEAQQHAHFSNWEEMCVGLSQREIDAKIESRLKMGIDCRPDEEYRKKKLMAKKDAVLNTMSPTPIENIPVEDVFELSDNLNAVITPEIIKPIPIEALSVGTISPISDDNPYSDINYAETCKREERELMTSEKFEALMKAKFGDDFELKVRDDEADDPNRIIRKSERWNGKPYKHIVDGKTYYGKEAWKQERIELGLSVREE
jgi:hypothetical protein